MSLTPDLPSRETRPYSITKDGEAIKAIGGFQLMFVGRPGCLEDAEEKRFADLLNGAVSNICDNPLRKRLGVIKDGTLPPDVLEQRPSWIELLHNEAKDFLHPEYSLYECTKATAIAIGNIQASIRCIQEKSKSDPRNDFSGTVWKLMSEHGKQAKKCRYGHHILTTISITGSIVGTVAVAADGIDGNRLILGILLAFPTIAFAIEKGFSVADNAQWNQNARDAYSALSDEFYFKKLPVEQAVEMLNALRARLAQTRPAISRIAEPARPASPPHTRDIT